MKVHIYSNSDYDKTEEKRWQLVTDNSSICADEVTINCPTRTTSDWIGNSLIDSVWCEAVKLQILDKKDKIQVIID